MKKFLRSDFGIAFIGSVIWVLMLLVLINIPAAIRWIAALGGPL